MSDTFDIDALINKYNNLNQYNKIKNDIDNIFNNILDDTCYIYYDIPTYTLSVLGVGNTIKLSDFTFLIPNLFRKCYAQLNASTPYICPTYNNPQNTTSYYPALINVDLIKSFLYFNFPCSINYINNNNTYNMNFINSLNIFMTDKKFNSTYNSYTTPLNVIYNIYSTNSLLVQLMNFNNYLSQSYNSYIAGTIINNFNIIWDFTKECVSYTDSKNIYTIGNFLNGYSTINQSTGYILYNTNNSLLNFYNSSVNPSGITTNGLIILQDNSIFTILEIAKSVFEDVIEEIQYEFESKFYCKKAYMYTYNIPTLLKIYKNYYNNQIYTINNGLTTTPAFNTQPIIITIQSYVSKFIQIYTYENPNNYNIKIIYLNSGTDAFVFFSYPKWGTGPVGTPITYIYYYISISNPSAVQLFSNNRVVIPINTYTVNDLTTYSNDYNAIYTNYTGYSVTNTVSYTNAGLFTQAGTNSSSNCNGLICYYTDSSNILQTISFQTLISNRNNVPETTTNGITLIYYNYDF